MSCYASYSWISVLLVDNPDDDGDDGSVHDTVGSPTAWTDDGPNTTKVEIIIRNDKIIRDNRLLTPF